jgi:type VI secretion system protein ImpK
MIPTPGGRRPAQASPGATPREPAPAAEIPSLSGGLNPLVAAANPLLNIVAQLRGTIQHPDPSGLREFLAQNIRAFESRAKSAGVAPERVVGARYVLCTLLDETAASTPWGGSGMWGKHSLLVLFHNETWGGEKFFQLLSKLAENPAGNRDLLELMYICLAMGLEGRYRVIDNGRSQLEAVRERLLQMLRNQRGEYEHDLSGHWRGVDNRRNPVLSALPVWVVGAVCGLILLGAFLTYSFRLNQHSDPVFAAIQGVRVQAQAQPVPAVPRPAAAVPAKPRLAGFLEPEIKAGLVAVRDEDNRSVITIRGDGLFEPGSATVSPQFEPLLRRIGEALNGVAGKVLITGHTDGQPIRSARFPSNWHLSQERARSVQQLLTTQVAAARLTAEGRADSERIAPDDTPANRSRNRRVEITLFVAAPTGA